MSHSSATSTVHLYELPNPAALAQPTGSATIDLLVHTRTLHEERSWRMREIDVLEDERRRLARDLHDEAGHRLTAATLQLDVIAQRYRQDPELRASLDATRRLIQECAAGLHDVAFNLRPCILADLGLVPAIRSLARRAQEAAGIPITVELDGTPQRLPERIELAAFRIVQEALTNVLKYAQASAVTVRATFSDGTVELAITDNGIGFDIVQHHTGRPRLGLAGIRERAELVGGEMRLQTQPGRGTSISVRLPWTEVCR